MDQITGPKRRKPRVYLIGEARFPRDDAHAWADYIEDQIGMIRQHLRIQWVILVVVLWDVASRFLGFLDHPF